MLASAGKTNGIRAILWLCCEASDHLVIHRRNTAKPVSVAEQQEGLGKEIPSSPSLIPGDNSWIAACCGATIKTLGEQTS